MLATSCGAPARACPQLAPPLVYLTQSTVAPQLQPRSSPPAAGTWCTLLPSSVPGDLLTIAGGFDDDSGVPMSSSLDLGGVVGGIAINGTGPKVFWTHVVRHAHRPSLPSRAHLMASSGFMGVPLGSRNVPGRLQLASCSICTRLRPGDLMNAMGSHQDERLITEWWRRSMSVAQTGLNSRLHH
jgi:hypothetical protein